MAIQSHCCRDFEVRPQNGGQSHASEKRPFMGRKPRPPIVQGRPGNGTYETASMRQRYNSIQLFILKPLDLLQYGLIPDVMERSIIQWFCLCNKMSANENWKVSLGDLRPLFDTVVATVAKNDSRYSVRNLDVSIRFSLKSRPSEGISRPEMSQIKAEISLHTSSWFFIKM